MSRWAPLHRFQRRRHCCRASAAAVNLTCHCSASREHTFFTDGARELFDCAGQGRVDVFFLSGGQIDGEGNINLVSIGDYAHPKARFPGSFGAAYLYYVVPKVILFRVEHSRRTLVPKVDFISAPGGSPDNVFRPGGPIALVTNRCLFDFDRERRRFRLASVHPGHSVEEVIENTGFDFDQPNHGAGHAGAVRGNAAAAAHRRRADAGRGLSAIREEGVRYRLPLPACGERVGGEGASSAGLRAAVLRIAERPPHPRSLRSLDLSPHAGRGEARSSLRSFSNWGAYS